MLCTALIPPGEGSLYKIITITTATATTLMVVVVIVVAVISEMTCQHHFFTAGRMNCYRAPRIPFRVFVSFPSAPESLAGPECYPDAASPVVFWAQNDARDRSLSDFIYPPPHVISLLPYEDSLSCSLGQRLLPRSPTVANFHNWPSCKTGEGGSRASVSSEQLPETASVCQASVFVCALPV